MVQQSSQVQLRKEIKTVSDKLDRLEAEVKLILKRINHHESSLDRGIKELKAGKYRTYSSVAELDRAIRERG